MLVSDVKHLYESGTEIACHGDEHNNNILNIISGLRKLQNWFTEQKFFGFASPHSLIDLSQKTLNQLKTNEIKYVRIGPFIGDAPLFSKIIRKLAICIKSKRLLFFVFRTTINKSIVNNYLIKSVPVMHDYSVEQMLYIAKMAIKKMVCFYVS